MDSEEQGDEEHHEPECMSCIENGDSFPSRATRECAKYDYYEEDHHYFVPGAICSSCCEIEFQSDPFGCFEVCQDEKAIPKNLGKYFEKVFKLDGLQKYKFRKAEGFINNNRTFLISKDLSSSLEELNPKKIADYIEDEVNGALYVKSGSGVIERYSLDSFKDVKNRLRPAIYQLTSDMRTTDDGLLFLVYGAGKRQLGAVVAPQVRDLIQPSGIVESYVEQTDELIRFFNLHPNLTSSTNQERIASSLDSLDEDGLIDKVAVPLLKSIGYTDVQRIQHHGPGELGLDIGPFFKPNALDPAELEYAGAQVKAKKIHGTAGSTEGSVYELMNQIDAAFEKSRTIRGRNEHIRELYVICSGEITHDAEVLLADKIQNLRSERKIVILIKKARLIEMMEEKKIPITFR